MPEIIFKLVGFVLFGVYMGIRVYWRRRNIKYLETTPVATRSDAREKRVLGFTGLLALPVFVWFFSPWLDFAQVDVEPWIRWAGAALFALGVALFAATHAALDHNWSPMLEIRESATLVTSGPYRFVRHPMYSAAFVIDIGLSLLSANWLVAFVLLGGMVLLYATRVRDEERLMLDAFGPQYEEYMRRTGRLVPRLGARA